MGADFFTNDTDHFDFQPKLTNEPTAPEPYEVKLEEVMVSTYNIGSEHEIDGFITEGATDAAHSGGMYVVMCDGSVRSYNPYITVDYMEVI